MDAGGRVTHGAVTEDARSDQHPDQFELPLGVVGNTTDFDSVIAGLNPAGVASSKATISKFYGGTSLIGESPCL